MTLPTQRSGAWIISISILGGGYSSVAKSLNSHGGRFDYETETLVTHALKGEGHDASEDGTGRGVPLVTAIQAGALRENPFSGPDGIGVQEDLAYTLEARAEVQAIAETLTKSWHNSNGAKAGNQVGVLNPIINRSGVRRLTPRECERLQGFPDDYTLITYRGKPAKDSPRYRAIGNSMARPVMLWIGRRIQMVSDLA